MLFFIFFIALCGYLMAADLDQSTFVYRGVEEPIPAAQFDVKFQASGDQPPDSIPVVLQYFSNGDLLLGAAQADGAGSLQLIQPNEAVVDPLTVQVKDADLSLPNMEDFEIDTSTSSSLSLNSPYLDQKPLLALFRGMKNEKTTFYLKKKNRKWFESKLIRDTNRWRCDDGMCDECTAKFGYQDSLESCEKYKRDEYYGSSKVTLARIHCFASLTACRVRSFGALRCPWRPQFKQMCELVESYARDCSDMKKALPSKLDWWADKCRFTISKADWDRYHEQYSWLPYYPIPGGHLRFFDRVTAYCSATHYGDATWRDENLSIDDGLSYEHKNALTRQKCDEFDLHCLGCESQTQGSSCTELQYCSENTDRDIHSVNSNYTLGWRQVELDLSCKCHAPNQLPDLQLTKLPSGYVQFRWPQLMNCDYRVNFFIDDVMQGSSTEYVNARCGNNFIVEEPTQGSFNVASQLPGTKLKFSVAGIVKTGGLVTREESVRLDKFLNVPFDQVLVVSVTTEGRSPVVARNVTFTIELTDEQRGANSVWDQNASNPQLPHLYDMNRSGHSVTGLSIVVQTNSKGEAGVRVFYPTDGAASAAIKYENLKINVQPAIEEYNVTLSYDVNNAACGSACSKSVDLRFDDESSSIAFIDKTVITFSGKVPFLHREGCFANDLIVEAFSADTGESVATAETEPDGLYSMVIQQGVGVQLRFRRQSVPEYYYTLTDDSLFNGVPHVDIEPQRVDYTVVVPFKLATTIEDNQYTLPFVSIPIVAGLCDFELSDGVKYGDFKWRSHSCNNNEPFAMTNVPPQISSSGNALVVRRVPPLQFVDLQLTLAHRMPEKTATVSAANSYFAANLAAQSLDARLPQLEAELAAAQPNQPGEPTNVADKHLHSMLADRLLLSMPFDIDSKLTDVSSFRHAAAQTQTAALAIEDNAVLFSNESALTFGKNVHLDVGRYEAASLSLWIKISRIHHQEKALLFVVTGTTENRFELAMEPSVDSQFSLVLRAGGNLLVRKTEMLFNQQYHVVVTVQHEGDASIYVDTKRTATVLVPKFPIIDLATCNEDFQYDCVQETTIAAASVDGQAAFTGSIKQLALWARELDENDVAFIYAAGRDGVPLQRGDAGDTAPQLLPSTHFPRYVYRTAVTVSDPSVTYFQPAAENINKTLAQLLTGQTLNSHKCESNEDSALTPFQLHKVKHEGMVSIQTEFFEEYDVGKCYQVRGKVLMRSTFTTACAPAANNMNNDEIMPCEGNLGANAFGYSHFRGLVSEAKLIPIDTEATDGGSTLQFNEKSFEEIRPYLGEFTIRFEGQLGPAEKTLWFHVSGFKGPEFPSVYALPANDIPLLRLYKPPGDQSQSFLERSWANSVSLALSSSFSGTMRVEEKGSAKVHQSVGATTCVGGGVGAGLGAFAFGVAMVCSDNSASWWAELNFESSQFTSRSNSKSLGEAFESQVLTRFETAITDGLVGKSGDVIVTAGFTILVTQSFYNTLNESASCSIAQEYSPTWTPSDQGVVDSLQITPRVAIPSMISDFQALMEVEDKACDNKLSGVKYSELTERAKESCTKLQEDGTKTPVTDENEIAQIVKRYSQAHRGYGLWSGILKNWEAMFCAALEASGTKDYYADPANGIPECSTNGTEGVIGTPKVWSVMGANNNVDAFQQAQSNAENAITELFQESPLVSEYCTDEDGFRAFLENSPYFGNHTKWQVFDNVNCGSLSSNTSYNALKPNDNVYKLVFTGPGLFTYITSGTVTHTETYDISSESGWEAYGSVGGGNTLSVEAAMLAIDVDWSLTIGLGGSETTSSGMSADRITSDTTAVGFTIGDDETLDTFGVSVFTDTVYGTPIFVTTGGWTMCPHEPGTNSRQAFSVFPEGSTPATAIRLHSDDPDGLIELDFSAKGDSVRKDDSGSGWVFNLQVSGEQDAIVTYKESLLETNNLHQIQFGNTGFTKFGPIQIKRGKRFSYDLVHVYAISDCDDGVASMNALMNGVYYNLTWTPKCAVVDIDTRMNSESLFPTEREFFIINADTPNVLDVNILNPEPMTAPWTLIETSFNVKLQYRADTEQSQWKDVPLVGNFPRPTFCQVDGVNACSNGCTETNGLTQVYRQVCDDTRGCCDGVGLECRAGLCQYASPTSNATVSLDTTAFVDVEGYFEMRAVSVCSMATTTSAPVKGRIDRVRPRLFGAFQQPEDRLWWPGDNIGFRFTEELFCERPFVFIASIKVDDVVMNLEDSVDIVCNLRSVDIAFSRQIVRSPELLIGKEVTLQLDGVSDLALNTHQGSAEWSFTVGEFNPSTATVSLSDVRVPLDLVLGANDVNAAVAAALLDAGQPLSQISVTSSDSGGAGRKRQLVRSFDIEIRPANSVAGGVSALEIANSMLTRAEQQNIVVSGVQMQAPNTPAETTASTSGDVTTSDGVTDSTLSTTSTQNPPGGAQTPALTTSEPGVEWYIIVIAVLGGLLCIGIIAAIGVCLVRRKNSDGDTGNSTAASARATPMTPVSSPPPALAPDGTVKRRVSSRRRRTGSSRRVANDGKPASLSATTSSGRRRKRSSRRTVAANTITPPLIPQTQYN